MVPISFNIVPLGKIAFHLSGPSAKFHIDNIALHALFDLFRSLIASV